MLFIMSDIEKRRLKLLQETRKSYSEKYAPPAIHPRFQSTYLSLYSDEIEEHSKSHYGFLSRTIIAILVFALCFIMEQQNETIWNIDSQTIVNIVQEDLFSK